MTSLALPDDKIRRLRDEHYNAQLMDIVSINDELRILRVRHDQGRLEFAPGQYAFIGLGLWEPREPGTQPETISPDRLGALAKRAYSISCPMIDQSGRLVRTRDSEQLEFYVSLVRRAASRPPVLTPRLFQLGEGDRLWVGGKATGTYVLQRHRPEDAIVFVATGTGEAPHNAMLPELLAAGHAGPIVSLTCVRYKSDLGYLAQHRRLEERFANYRYIALATREPENLDASRPDYVGKQYPQDYLRSGKLEHDLVAPLDPERTHFYLCGNPAMIGLPVTLGDGSQVFPQPVGMAELLTERGFRLDRAHSPGNVHYERYW